MFSRTNTNNPAGGSGSDERMYAGGNKYFNEKTGQYEYGDSDERMHTGGNKYFDERTGQYVKRNIARKPFIVNRPVVNNQSKGQKFLDRYMGR